MAEQKKAPFALNMLKLGVVLLGIAAAVALVLGLVNLLTAKRIEKLSAEKMQSAMETVLAAESYTALDYSGDDSAVDGIWQAGNAGWVVQCTVTGSQGEITLICGVDQALTCTGISITDSSETAGLGAVASQASEKGEAFRAQFVGQSGTVAVTKNGGTIDALSGATITSKAVCSAVTSALNACAGLGGTTAPAAQNSAAAAPTGSGEPAAQPASTQTQSAPQASGEAAGPASAG